MQNKDLDLLYKEQFVTEEADCAPEIDETADIIPDIIVTNRTDIVTFSLSSEIDTTNATIEWTVKDKWLGSDEDILYCPTLATTGMTNADIPELENYVDRIITGSDFTISTNIFYPGDIKVVAKVIVDDTETNYKLTYNPYTLKENTIDKTLMEIKWGTVNCAPMLTTHKIVGFYRGDKTKLYASALTLSDAENLVGKIVGGFNEPVFTRQTWRTTPEKYLAFTVWFDNGFLLKKSTIYTSFIVNPSDIIHQDSPCNGVPAPGMPYDDYSNMDTPKIYVLCTKRCITGIQDEYSFSLTSSE